MVTCRPPASLFRAAMMPLWKRIASAAIAKPKPVLPLLLFPAWIRPVTRLEDIAKHRFWNSGTAIQNFHPDMLLIIRDCTVKKNLSPARSIAHCIAQDGLSIARRNS